MKQGTAKTVSDTKVEPKSTAVLPAYPATLGTHRGNHVDGKGDIPFATIPMADGHGLQAPLAGHTSHLSGSQGKHK